LLLSREVLRGQILIHVEDTNRLSLGHIRGGLGLRDKGVVSFA